MNVIKDLIERIEKRRKETKNPCKSYATEAAAETVAETYAIQFAMHFAKVNVRARPCRYIVVYNAAWGRWVIGFDLTELMNRTDSTGGYLGIISDHGFYSY